MLNKSKQKTKKSRKPPKPNSAEALRVVRDRAEKSSLDFFHDEQSVAYATVPVQDHRETWEIRSRIFRLWVTKELREQLGVPPKKQWVKDCIDEMETESICTGREEHVFVRVAEKDRHLYIDLANPHWQVADLAADEWRILDDSPVKFKRSAGLAPLPYPKLGGLVRELSQFLNLHSEQDEILILTWLTYVLQMSRPYPIVCLSGVQGSGKSTSAKILRALIDPSHVPLTTIPKSERDLAIAATNSHVITLDNISDISASLSDALCRIATGASFRCRKLYSDNEETLLQFRRPVVLNGIEELPMRPDLLDRSILIHLEPIAPGHRRDEHSFWKAFDEAQPGILGAIYTVARLGQKLIDQVHLSSSPRMADFARWGVAVEELLGFPAGSFMAAYTANIEHGVTIGLEASPIAWVLHDYLKQQKTFEGTARDLLLHLRDSVPNFPKTPSRLSAELDRIQPNLEKLGITIDRWRTKHKRFIRLVLTEPSPSSPSPNRESDDAADTQCDATTVTVNVPETEDIETDDGGDAVFDDIFGSKSAPTRQVSDPVTVGGGHE